jgi:hypothetical protein
MLWILIAVIIIGIIIWIFKPQRPTASVKIEMDTGRVKFEHSDNNFFLIVLLITLFLKVRWLLSQQQELGAFKDNYFGIINNYPASFDGISRMFILMRELDGINTFKLYVNRAGLYIISNFPISYSNVSIIHISLILLDKTYQLLNQNEKNVLYGLLSDVKDYILDDNEDTSMTRLSLFNKTVFDLVFE